MNLSSSYRFWTQLDFHRLKFNRSQQGYQLWLTANPEETHLLHLPQMQIASLEPETHTLTLSFHPHLPETYQEIYQLQKQLIQLVHEHSAEIFKMEVPFHKLQHRFHGWLQLPTQLEALPTLVLPLSADLWNQLELHPEQIGGWIQLTLQFQHLCLKPTSFFLEISDVQVSPPQSSDQIQLDSSILENCTPVLEMSRSQLVDLDSDFE